MISAILSAVVGLAGKAIDKAVPDKDKALELKTAVTQQLLQMDSQEMKGAIDIVLAEARGESWLQRNWRPLTMLTFVGLIVARWLGFAAPGMSEAEYMAIWEIMKIGLGGYVLGRSAEKVAKVWKAQQ